MGGGDLGLGSSSGSRRLCLPASGRSLNVNADNANWNPELFLNEYLLIIINKQGKAEQKRNISTKKRHFVGKGGNLMKSEDAFKNHLYPDQLKMINLRPLDKD